jgi:hypothetical protein
MGTRLRHQEKSIRLGWSIIHALVLAIGVALPSGCVAVSESGRGLEPAKTGAHARFQPALAKTIRDDADLDVVLARAEALMQQGLTAGGHYREVWIRDLNTFIELALRVADQGAVRDALVTFFQFQGQDGNIVDGYVPVEQAAANYNSLYIDSWLSPGLRGLKNTVESDQESSLVQAVYKYVTLTGDRSILYAEVAGETISARMARALRFLLDCRYSERFGLIWGATTADWGDVQPEDAWGVSLSKDTHRAIDIYDNAMLIIAMRDYAELIGVESSEGAYWRRQADQLRSRAREHLWDAERSKFIPHVYLNGSPFPADFNERDVYFHGGTAVAIEAGVLEAEEVLSAHRAARHNIESSGVATIGLSVFPPYPAGFFKNPEMSPYSYQNGGDWTWFGARWVSQLVRYGRPDLAYAELKPMIRRVVENNGFYEWYDRSNRPRGANNFKGAAGVLGGAIIVLKQWAEAQDK